MELPQTTDNPPKNRARKAIAVSLLLAIFLGIGGIFWYTDWVYSLPTPIPKQYHAVESGVYIDLGGKLPTASNRPVFLHFFNPDCPCSRFNVPHFRSLVKKYDDKITFAVIVLNNTKYTAREIQSKFDLDIPVFFDSSMAAACGVYSTPQAVLLDAGHHLYYRGNYNKSRYCTDERTNFAQMAIDSLFRNVNSPVFSGEALKAYGCQLPVCTQK